MKYFATFLCCTGALMAAVDDDPVVRMMDTKLNVTQRNDACYALRHDRSPKVIAAMRAALPSQEVQACAARNLREAGAVEELKNALYAPEPAVRAVAAREIGTFQKPELIEPLVKAAHDPNMLVASNAVAGLGQYESPAVLPHLLDLAKGGGPIALAALSRSARFQDPAVLALARKQLSSPDVVAKLVCLRIISERGDKDDLPTLREIAATSKPLENRGRGFGLLRSVDLALIAKNAIAEIETRTGKPSIDPPK